MTRALIFANGRPHDGPLVRQILAGSADAWVVAADGGARLAREFGRPAQTVIGDLDSLDTDELAELEAQGVEIIRHPAEKDQNDLELALKLAVARGATWMRVFGAMGGRLDQTLANIYLLALPELRGRDVRLVSRAQEAWLLHPGTEVIQGTVGDTVSLIPLNGAVQGIETISLYYPLNNETLMFGPARGISNVMESDEAVVKFRQGLLLVVHTLGKA
jgi:thiamine pyrophosphokinase